jgi:hypothetical protein
VQKNLKSGRDQSVRGGRFPLFWVAVFDCTPRPFSRVPRNWHYKLKSSAEIMAKSGSKIVIIFLPILGAIAAP